MTIDDLVPTTQPTIITGGSHIWSPQPPKQHRTKKRFTIIKEITIFSSIMVVSGIIGIVFTNLKLFKATIMEDFLGMTRQWPAILTQLETTLHDTSRIIKSQHNNHHYIDTKDHLKTALVSTKLVFNTLPPDNRVIVEDLWIDAPIVDIHYYTPEKLENWDFKEELERGVIRYPNTGTPDKGNMLIFGHTSDYRWNNNPFGQVFRSIPKMNEWHLINIVWNNQIHTYKVVAKKVVKPKNVSQVYAQYHNTEKQYLTLVWCYPIGTASQRIVLVAEKISSSTIQPNTNEVIQLAQHSW